MGGGVVRVALNGGAESGKGVVHAAQVGEDVAHVGAAEVVFGVELRSAAEGRQGFVIAVKVAEGNAEVVPRLPVVGEKLGSAAAEVLCFGKLPNGEQCGTETGGGLEVIGAELEGFAIGRNGGARIAEVVQGATEVEDEFGVLRIEHGGFLKIGQRLTQALEVA